MLGVNRGLPMKPLHNVDSFLQRFNHFKGGEFRSLEIVSATQITITLAGQDEARAFDWVSVVLEFHGVVDARLLDDSKISFLNMDDGITLLKENHLAFGVGECYNLSTIKSSSCFIVSHEIKYEEGERGTVVDRLTDRLMDRLTNKPTVTQINDSATVTNRQADRLQADK